MSVVGFDFGNESCKVAVARRRGIDVLQNEIGNRKTATIVGYQGKQRFIGDSAVAQQQSNIKNTVVNMKRLLGKRFDDAELKYEQQFFHNKVVNMEGGRLGLQVTYDEKDERVLPEQVCGAMFTILKKVAESGLDGSKVVDCVIGVPVFWTDVQRRALIDAAQIAGLNVLRLMNETTAVALNYGILRPLPDKVSQKVLFFDMGETSTNVSLVSFVQGKLAVLATAPEPNLGGRDFDWLLVEHFAADIKKRYKLDVLSDPKARYKLYKECNRVKKILSANSKVVFNVEYIMNDTDVKGMIERPEFEALATQSKLFDRLLKPLNAVLEQAGVKKEELQAMEVVGGSVRVPIVQQKLQEWFGREISKTCDSDESIARGCALQCAMLSPSFKVKEFEVADIAQYPIELAWGPASSKVDNSPSIPMDVEMESQTLLFPPRNPFPNVKIISFKERTQPFQLIAKYQDMKLVSPGTPELIGKFVISGIPTPKDPKNIPKIKVRIKMDLHGVLSVPGAQLIEETEEAGSSSSATPATPTTPSTPADASQSSGPTPMDESSDKKDGAKADTADKAKDDSKKDDAKPMDTSGEKKTKKKVNRTNLTVTPYTVGGISPKTLAAAQEKENQQANQDRIIHETNDARNKLEGYVLEMRNKLSSDLKDFIRAQHKEKFLADLQATEDWLYNDGLDVQKSEYVKRMNDLRQAGDAAESRRYEQEHRLEFASALKKTVLHYQQWAASTDEKWAHITPEERKKVADECASAEHWLATELSKQEKIPIADAPVVTTTQINDRKTKLENFCQPIMSRAKPEPPKPKAEDKKPEDKKPDDKKPDDKKPEDKKPEEAKKPEEPKK